MTLSRPWIIAFAMFVSTAHAEGQTGIPLGEIVDSAEIAGGIHSAALDESHGVVIIWAGWQTRNDSAFATVLSSTLEAPVTDLVSRIVRRSVRNTKAGRAILLEVTLGDTVTITGRAAPTSKPQLLNATELRSKLAAASRRVPRGGSGVVWIRVGTTGLPVAVEVSRTSGSVELDRVMVELAWDTRFVPAKVDKYPLEIWVEIPLQLTKM